MGNFAEHETLKDQDDLEHMIETYTGLIHTMRELEKMHLAGAAQELAWHAATLRARIDARLS
jgi:hypothetical protein